MPFLNTSFESLAPIVLRSLQCSGNDGRRGSLCMCTVYRREPRLVIAAVCRDISQWRYHNLRAGPQLTRQSTETNIEIIGQPSSFQRSVLLYNMLPSRNVAIRCRGTLAINWWTYLARVRRYIHTLPMAHELTLCYRMGRQPDLRSGTNWRPSAAEFMPKAGRLPRAVRANCGRIRAPHELLLHFGARGRNSTRGSPS